MNKANNKNKKCLAVLSTAAVGVLIASAVTTNAHAAVKSYITDDGSKVIKFDLNNLLLDYQNKLSGAAAPMFDEYLKDAPKLTAFEDDKKGFVDAKYVTDAYTAALIKDGGKTFVLDTVTEAATAANIKNVTVGYVAQTDGTVKSVTPTPVGTAVSSVSATNGTVTVKLSGTPDTTPTAADFAITQSVNGAASTTVTSLGMTWDASTNTASFSIAAVTPSASAQSVTVSVAYKSTNAVAGSFTVAALPTTGVRSVGYDVTTQNLVVIFDNPINVDATSTNLNNFYYDNDRNLATNSPAFATAAVFNAAEVGPYKANQILTLTVPATTLALSGQGTLTIQNLKDTAGRTITANVNVDITNAANDTAAPTATPATYTLKNGLATNTAATPVITAKAGDKVTFSATIVDAINKIDRVQYRVEKPDLTLTDWTDFTPADGKFNEATENVSAIIDTTGFVSGAYNIQTRSIDAFGNITAAPATNGTINVATSSDVTAPVTAAPTTVTFNNVATATRPVGSVTVTGAATDTAPGTVAKVQYRIREYSAVTTAYTVLKDWTDATSDDGAFDESAENYTFTTPTLDTAKNLNIEVRTVDAAGNTSASVNATPAAVAPVAAGPVAGTFTIAKDTTLPVLGGVPVVAPAGTAAAPANTKDVVITGTATDTAPGSVAKVEFAAYRDTDNNGSYDQVVRDFSATGVTANDGKFDSANESFTIHYTVPQDGAYQFVVRTTDASGNVETTTLANNAATTVIDTTKPTVVVAPNTATADLADYTVTFTEAITGTVTHTAANTLDATNFIVRNAAGDVKAVNTVTLASAGAPVVGTDNKQFVVSFTNADGTPALVAGDTIQVVGVQDAAANVVSSNTYTVK